MGAYAPFENIVFVDTLDNMGFQTQYMRQLGMFGLTDENLERIDRQNKRKISVVIGNPPYNANQLNENENNKNREYPEIDKRIKETYIKQSTAQKTKVYDMYARFYRWASDRIAEDGIIAFVTNRSFLDARTYDGFRKVVGEEFSHIYLVDLGGDVRKNPKLSGTKNNVFGIQTGVTIAFLVKTKAQTEKDGRSPVILSAAKYPNNPETAGMFRSADFAQHDTADSTRPPCQIFYVRRPEMETAVDKLRFLAANPFSHLAFTPIHPDKQHNWINLAENDWEDFLPIASKDTKLGKEGATGAIFRLFSLGNVTARDDWVYDFDLKTLQKKVRLFCDSFALEQGRWSVSQKLEPINNFVDRSIKWTSELEDHLKKDSKLIFNERNFRKVLHRPFVRLNSYFDRIITHRQYQLLDIFPTSLSQNTVIAFNFGTPQFACLASSNVFDYALLKFGNGSTQCLPLYRYDSQGHRHDNITDYALTQFQNHYGPQPPAGSEPAGGSPSPHPPITKLAIFHYVYAVLHHPAYRQKYELNLKREFPRIPFYPDFWQWAEWGRQLMELHLNYETVEPYPLERAERTEPTRQPTKARLKADKTAHLIELDTDTTLAGIPPIAWEYKLGNRSALEWVLDRYKESTPKDPTIRQKFNTYRFRDYKEQVIDLLARVTTVSVQTMALIAQMPAEIV